jgi:hypothetical protein
MERVSTLIKQLQEQLENQRSAADLLNTSQMLVAELSGLHHHSHIEKDKVSIIMPLSVDMISQNHESDVHEEKVVEVLQVDEKAIEEELEQIKRNAEAKNAMSMHARPDLVYDPIEDMPTLAHQDPLPKKKVKTSELPFEYPQSLNDRLKEEKIELSEKLTEAPIKDLRKAIGVNDRYVFLNELFRGDEAMYERSIKTIQNFSILAEAEYWIRRELKVKIGWHDSHPVVKQFDQLVRRRFAN